MSLCLLAFTRGLLKPYYRSGSVSVLSENLVLAALQREFDAEELRQTIAIAAESLGNPLLKSMSKSMRKYAKELSDSFNYQLFKDISLNMRASEKQSEIDAMGKLYHAMTEGNILNHG